MFGNPVPEGYHQFLSYIFDRPEASKRGKEWYWRDDFEGDLQLGEQQSLELQTYLFENCEADMAPFTDNQVAMGLEFLTNNGISSEMFSFMSQDMSPKLRFLAISSMKHLYSGCFAKRCTHALAHLNEQAGRLNGVCYMLWDISPLLPGLAESDSHHRAALLGVLNHGLTLGHAACTESALHGLGHLADSCPEEVETMIDKFLKNMPPRLPRKSELESYAKLARTGIIQ